MFPESHRRIMYIIMNVYQIDHILKGSDLVFTVSAIVVLLEKEKYMF